MPLNISGSVITGGIAKVSNYKSVITRGLVLYLEGGAAESIPETGTTWSDIANTYNGTLTNGAAYSSAGSGSVSFDGTNDYVGFSGTTGILNGLSSATMNMWININRKSGGGEQYQQIGGWRDDVDADFFFLLLDSSGATVNTEARVKTTSGGPYDINANFVSYFGTWAYVSFVVDTNRMDLYVNGSVIGSNTSKTGTFGTSNELRIGQNLSSLYSILGNIADFYVYNRALAAAEVTQNYNAQKGRFGII